MSETKWLRGLFVAVCVGVAMYAYTLVTGHHQISDWEARIQRIEYDQKQQDARNEGQDKLNDIFISEFKKLIKN